MASSDEGLIIPVGVDTSPLKAGLSGAQNDVKQFTKGTNEALAQTQNAMGGVAAATDKTKNSTKSLGDMFRETGSRRDLMESLRHTQGALTGTASAFEVCKSGIEMFAMSLGGPAMVAITATIAALSILAVGLKKATEEQKALNQEAAVLGQSVDDVRNMTSAMKDFTTQLTAYKLGFGQLSQSQIKIFEAYGIDPQSSDAAKKLLVAISNTVSDEQQKIKTYAIATGKSFEDAAKVWSEQHKEMEQKADGFWARMAKMQAAASLSEAGNYAEAARIQREAFETKGDRLGSKENSITSPVLDSKTQDQIDDERKLHDQLFDLRRTAAAARVAIMQDEVAKIREQAKLETQALLHEKEVQLRDVVDPSHRQQISAAYDQTIAAKQAATEQNARQVARQAALDEEKAFRSQMAALSKANDDATAAASLTAGDKIRNDAQQRINALRKMLDDYFSSPEFQKLSAANQASKKGELNSQFDATASNITATSTANARKADHDQQIQQEREFQDALNAITAEGEDARISMIENVQDQILALGEQRIVRLNEQYEKDLENLRKNVQDKAEVEKKAAQLTAARDEAARQIRVQTAKRAADEQIKPIKQLVENWSDSTKNLNQLWANSMQGMATGITQFAMGAERDFGQMALAIIADLIQIQIQKQLAGIFGGLFGGFGGGGTAMAGGTSLSGATIGMAASGGNIDGPTWVGERGPEIFDPTAGRIIPNGAATHAAGGGSTAVHVSIDNKGTPQRVASASATQTPKGIITSIVLEDLKSGGAIAQGIQGKYGVRPGGR